MGVFGVLQDLCLQLRTWEVETDQLQGCQVFAVASALQALSSKLEW